MYVYMCSLSAMLSPAGRGQFEGIISLLLRWVLNVSCLQVFLPVACAASFMFGFIFPSQHDCLKACLS